jgi:Ca2+-binding EF-hand superfamily protein
VASQLVFNLAVSFEVQGYQFVEVEETLKTVFEVLDTDCSGTVDLGEISRAIEDTETVKMILGVCDQLRPLLNSGTWRKTFLSMDTDGSGGLDLEEFQRFIMTAVEQATLLGRQAANSASTESTASFDEPETKAGSGGGGAGDLPEDIRRELDGVFSESPPVPNVHVAAIHTASGGRRGEGETKTVGFQTSSSSPSAANDEKPTPPWRVHSRRSMDDKEKGPPHVLLETRCSIRTAGDDDIGALFRLLFKGGDHDLFHIEMAMLFKAVRIDETVRDMLRVSDDLRPLLHQPAFTAVFRETASAVGVLDQDEFRAFVGNVTERVVAMERVHDAADQRAEEQQQRKREAQEKAAADKAAAARVGDPVTHIFGLISSNNASEVAVADAVTALHRDSSVREALADSDHALHPLLDPKALSLAFRGLGHTDMLDEDVFRACVSHVCSSLTGDDEIDLRAGLRAHSKGDHGGGDDGNDDRHHLLWDDQLHRWVAGTKSHPKVQRQLLRQESGDRGGPDQRLDQTRNVLEEKADERHTAAVLLLERQVESHEAGRIERSKSRRMDQREEKEATNTVVAGKGGGGYEGKNGEIRGAGADGEVKVEEEKRGERAYVESSVVPPHYVVQSASSPPGESKAGFGHSPRRSEHTATNEAEAPLLATLAAPPEATTVRRDAGEVFALIDKDGSGHVDKVEIAKAVRSDASVRDLLNMSDHLQMFLRPRAFAAAFSTLDGDSDGKVSLAEFRAFATGVAEAAPSLESDDVGEVFAMIDIDGSGHVDKGEIVKAVRSDASVRDLLKMSDHLQMLLRPRAFADSFRALDGDSDGKVSLDEFRAFAAGVAEAAPKRAEDDIAEVFALIDRDGGGHVDKGEVIRAVKSNHHVRDLLRVVPSLQGLLRPRALAAALRLLDTDRDGKVSLAEFRTFVASSTTGINTGATLTRPSGEGVGGGQQGMAVLPVHDDIGEVFAMIDTDNSGHVDKGEILRSCQGDAHVRDVLRVSGSLSVLLRPRAFAVAFRSLDADRNGQVSLEEFRAFAQSAVVAEVVREVHVVEAAAANGGGGLQGEGDGGWGIGGASPGEDAITRLFRMIDGDGHGRVGKSDMRASVNDDKIRPILEAVQELRPLLTPSFDWTFQQMDDNGDGSIDLSEFRAFVLAVGHQSEARARRETMATTLTPTTPTAPMSTYLQLSGADIDERGDAFKAAMENYMAGGLGELNQAFVKWVNSSLDRQLNHRVSTGSASSSSSSSSSSSTSLNAADVDAGQRLVGATVAVLLTGGAAGAGVNEEKEGNRGGRGNGGNGGKGESIKWFQGQISFFDRDTGKHFIVSAVSGIRQRSQSLSGSRSGGEGNGERNGAGKEGGGNWYDLRTTPCRLFAAGKVPPPMSPHDAWAVPAGLVATTRASKSTAATTFAATSTHGADEGQKGGGVGGSSRGSGGAQEAAACAPLSLSSDWHGDDDDNGDVAARPSSSNSASASAPAAAVSPQRRARDLDTKGRELVGQQVEIIGDGRDDRARRPTQQLQNTNFLTEGEKEEIEKEMKVRV